MTILRSTHSTYFELLWWLVLLTLAAALAVSVMSLPAY
jgi:hypothetical protein